MAGIRKVLGERKLFVRELPFLRFDQLVVTKALDLGGRGLDAKSARRSSGTSPRAPQLRVWSEWRYPQTNQEVTSNGDSSGADSSVATRVLEQRPAPDATLGMTNLEKDCLFRAARPR
jgi:hypothetical protein